MKMTKGDPSPATATCLRHCAWRGRIVRGTLTPLHLSLPHSQAPPHTTQAIPQVALSQVPPCTCSPSPVLLPGPDSSRPSATAPALQATLPRSKAHVVLPDCPRVTCHSHCPRARHPPGLWKAPLDPPAPLPHPSTPRDPAGTPPQPPRWSPPRSGATPCSRGHRRQICTWLRHHAPGLSLTHTQSHSHTITHTYTQTCVDMHTITHIHTHRHMHTQADTSTQTCIQTQTFTHNHTYTHRHACTSRHMHSDMCTYRHVQSHTLRDTLRHAHMHTHRPAGTQRHAHTCRYTHSQSHTHTHIQTWAYKHAGTHMHTETHTCADTYTHIYSVMLSDTPTQTCTHTHTT